MIEFTLPIRTVNITNVREHWSDRSRRAKQHRFAAKVMAMKHQAQMPVSVLLIRHSPGTLDDDAVGPALKSVRDGIADAFGVPDNDPRIRWHYDQAKAPRGQHFVTVRITPQE